MTHSDPAADTTPEEPKTRGWKLKRMFRKREPADLRTVIEDFIEKAEDALPGSANDPVAHEQALIANILQLRDLTAFDVMVPRAEISAISDDMDRDALVEFVRENPYSRFPVYKGTLDDVVGTVHIKDLFLAMAPNEENFQLAPLIREASIVSPSLPVLDVLVIMRNTRRHMVLVIDEYGGIDGLVTAGDVTEAIIGRLDDEHYTNDEPEFVLLPDGSVRADARLPIQMFEQHFGDILSEDEREEIDTLGGFVMALAGRIPARGEVLPHESGLEFEILDADPRRVLRLLIRPAQKVLPAA